jgi:hypothetical protein
MAMAGDRTIRRLQDAGSQVNKFAMPKAIASGDRASCKRLGSKRTSRGSNASGKTILTTSTPFAAGSRGIRPMSRPMARALDFR